MSAKRLTDAILVRVARDEVYHGHELISPQQASKASTMSFRYGRFLTLTSPRSHSQKPEESPSTEELAEMDKRTQQLRDETSNLNTAAKALRSTLSSLNSTLSTADLRAAITEMDAERAEILERLILLRSGNVQPVSKEEKEEVDKQAKVMEKTLLKRKKIVKVMWGQVTDNVPDPATVAGLKVRPPYMKQLLSLDKLTYSAGPIRHE